MRDEENDTSQKCDNIALAASTLLFIKDAFPEHFLRQARRTFVRVILCPKRRAIIPSAIWSPLTSLISDQIWSTRDQISARSPPLGNFPQWGGCPRTKKLFNPNRQTRWTKSSCFMYSCMYDYMRHVFETFISHSALRIF